MVEPVEQVVDQIALSVVRFTRKLNKIKFLGYTINIHLKTLNNIKNLSMVHMHIPKYRTLLLIRNATKNSKRTISKYLDKDKTSKAVRQRFLDYFINEHSHNFVRSSPVVPYCDPTVAFVNAGMNQVN